MRGADSSATATEPAHDATAENRSGTPQQACNGTDHEHRTEERRAGDETPESNGEDGEGDRGRPRGAGSLLTSTIAAVGPPLGALARILEVEIGLSASSPPMQPHTAAEPHRRI